MGEVVKQKEKKWRHGDVYGIQSNVKIGDLTANGTKLDNGILAYGEVTGHMHEILADPACFSRYELDGKKFLVVLADAGVQITHQEHGVGLIPKGIWEERIDREFDYLTHQFRPVYD